MATYVISRPQVVKCRLCGRIRLSRSQYAYRRAHGMPVWRCEHWRSRRKPNYDVRDALLIMIALLVLVLLKQ